MLISDLNHLETVEATQIIGGNSPRYIKIKFNKKINVKANFVSDVVSRPVVEGNVATGFVDSIATGKDTFTDSELKLDAKEGKYSHSTANGVAAVGATKY